MVFIILNKLGLHRLVSRSTIQHIHYKKKEGEIPTYASLLLEIPTYIVDKHQNLS